MGAPARFTHPDNPNAFESRAKLYAAVGGSQFGDAAVSGPGSTKKGNVPLIQFLVGWLSAHPHVRSMVEASCGHWPSGWQSSVVWPNNMSYVGADITHVQVDSNNKFVADRSPAAFGLASARFIQQDITKDALPAADVLLTKDTLVHLRNVEILSFLRVNVLPCPPRFRYVIFVGDPPGKPISPGENISDLGRGGSHGLDMSWPPFSLPIKANFTYKGWHNLPLLVQILDTRETCMHVHMHE